MTEYIEGFPVPVNDGDLPLLITRDSSGKIKKIEILFADTTIAQQFPWTRRHIQRDDG